MYVYTLIVLIPGASYLACLAIKVPINFIDGCRMVTDGMQLYTWDYICMYQNLSHFSQI